MVDSVLKSLEPEVKDYREKDSPGLYFRVKASGTKSWEFRYKRPDGKWSWFGLGGFPAISGKAAREEARRLLDLAADGIDLKEYLSKDDPVSEESAGTPFRQAAESWYQLKIDAGRAADTLNQMRRYLDSDIYPVIGDKLLHEVSRADCAEVQRRLERRKAYNIAKKVRSWVSQIFSQAIAEDLCELNPASELRHIAQKAPETKHYPYLLEDELPAFLKALRGSPSRQITMALVRLVLNTACRPGMARLAKWEDFDF